MAKPVDFRTIIDQIARKTGIPASDLLKGAGVSDWARYKWKDGAQPSEKTIAAIEFEHGIEFLRAADGVRVVGWRKKGEVGRTENEEVTDSVKASNPAGGIFDLFAASLRDAVEQVRSTYHPFSSLDHGEPMDPKDEALYEALYRILVRDLESIRDEAEAKLRNRIRTFESALDEHSIHVTQHQHKGAE